MAIRYGMLRIPNEDKIKLKKRAERLTVELRNLTNKKQKVSMTKVIKYYANQPLELYPYQIVQIFGKNKDNRINRLRKRTIW